MVRCSVSSTNPKAPSGGSALKDKCLSPGTSFDFALRHLGWAAPSSLPSSLAHPSPSVFPSNCSPPRPRPRHPGLLPFIRPQARIGFVLGFPPALSAVAGCLVPIRSARRGTSLRRRGLAGPARVGFSVEGGARGMTRSVQRQTMGIPAEKTECESDGPRRRWFPLQREWMTDRGRS